MEETTNLKAINQEMACKNCGAVLKFAPGTNHLKCDYCGHANEIAPTAGTATNDHVQELDFHAYLNAGANQAEKITLSTVKCTGCGAESTLKPNITSDDCAFCGTSLVIESGSTHTVIKPKSVLPFKIAQKDAFNSFGSWIKSLWFAPSDLKKYALHMEKLNGMYIPYWTFDCEADTNYTGQRGIHRHVSETYTATENGQSVQRTRTRVVTDWYPAFGRVHNAFDDILVNASNSLPRDYVDKLEPWDLNELVPFDEKYLSGFQTEAYQVELGEAFEHGKKKAEGTIEQTVRNDIGGNEQRIISMNVDWNDITFKHTLLPIWISAYRYNGKVYRFLINGRTGEVQGERPWSVIKIVMTIAGAIAAGWALYEMFGNS